MSNVSKLRKTGKKRKKSVRMTQKWTLIKKSVTTPERTCTQRTRAKRNKIIFLKEDWLYLHTWANESALGSWIYIFFPHWKSGLESRRRTGSEDCTQDCPRTLDSKELVTVGGTRLTIKYFCNHVSNAGHFFSKDNFYLEWFPQPVMWSKLVTIWKGMGALTSVV